MSLHTACVTGVPRCEYLGAKGTSGCKGMSGTEQIHPLKPHMYIPLGVVDWKPSSQLWPTRGTWSVLVKSTKTRDCATHTFRTFRLDPIPPQPDTWRFRRTSFCQAEPSRGWFTGIRSELVAFGLAHKKQGTIETAHHLSYRGTSPIRNNPTLGPCSGPMPRVLGWS